ncbi:MAG TPA: hypothetical protein VF290_17710 [Pyrinomonadaceae bacterium]|jgi:hypothetical protein
MDDLELVNTIEKIELIDVIGNPPVHGTIKVTGSVRRSGYTMPSLIIKSTTPDREGNLTFYFAAKPPDGGSPGQPIPIEARRSLFDLLRVRTLTVVSATNEMVKNL